ncbi:protein sel-1 homolog 3 [Nematostella vectensis]|uniref:protein sel-1 homolog 3 n=1 Tax=Nematostella vectensis TaxID=45351 RepID=UPI002077985B|nr:protein sel-1 homolog 3 [Nematostella vectensis]
MAATCSWCLCRCVILLLLCTASTNPQEIEEPMPTVFEEALANPPTEQVVEEALENSHKEQVVEDFVEIVQVPVYVSKNFDITIAFRCTDIRVITLELLSYGLLDYERKELRYNFIIPMSTKDIQTRIVHVTLRDSLVFGDNSAINIRTDLHTNSARVVVAMHDSDPWSLEPGQMTRTFARETAEIKVVPPWERPQKSGHCYQWYWNYIKNRSILKCGPLNDVKTFLEFPVAVTGKEEGFVKFLPNLYWPDMELTKAHKLSKPRFTISTWVYVTDMCSSTLCSILHHRNKHFLTPVISFLSSGQLHVQVHYKDSTPFAFLTHATIAWNTWVNIVVTVNNTRVHVNTRYGENFELGDATFHPYFPRGSFQYDDTDGHWVIGGNTAFTSFKGFIGPTTIYRLRAVPIEEIPLPPTDHSMFSLDLQDHFAHCSAVNARLTVRWEELIRERQMKEGSLVGACPAHQALDDWQSLTRPARVRHQCDVTLSGETPEVDQVLTHLLHNTTLTNMSAVGEQLYRLAAKALTKSVDSVMWALRLLRVSGCLGNAQAFYTSSVIHVTGLGVTRNVQKAWLQLLVSARDSHALSQMSLAYRYLIGQDGIPEDCDIAAGYYKMAAVTTDKVLQEHQTVHTHSEAVRLDDSEELANHRGVKSDLFQWLSHQAQQGLSEAQSIMADMHYYGKRGFTRDLEEAAKLYQMSAEQGNPEGQFNLGISKLKGHGTKKNVTEAVELIKKAADKDFGPALNALGFYEVNMRSNLSGAAIYFMRAAKKGDRDGLYNLGVAYDNGWLEGQPQDKKLAFRYFRSAADKGHPSACVLVGEELRVGTYLRRHCGNSVVYLRFLAEQNPELGWLLRRALDAYYVGNWYKTLVFFLLAGETGMDVPQYNTALLCEENPDLVNLSTVDCRWRYYNSSAELGWVHSMMKVGDNYWYGTSVPTNTTAAATMYAKAAAKDGHAHALYNLAYMVEYNYTLPHTIHWTDVRHAHAQTGNLTFAAAIYRSCRDTTRNGNESYLPCALGVLRVTVKDHYHKYPLTAQALTVVAVLLAASAATLLATADDRMV